jgi:hypothetical protein
VDQHLAYVVVEAKTDSQNRKAKGAKISERLNAAAAIRTK